MLILFEAITFFLILYGTIELLHHFVTSERQYAYVSSFFTIFCAGVFVLSHYDVFMHIPVSPFVLFWYGSIIAAYLLFSYIWRQRVAPEQIFGYHTLPKTYQYLAAPTVALSIAKITEIIFQNVLAVGFIMLLLQQQMDLWQIAMVFMAAAFVVHIPALWLYGRVFAGSFLVLVLLATPVFPYTVAATPYALYWLFAFHVAMYPLRLIILRLVVALK